MAAAARPAAARAPREDLRRARPRRRARGRADAGEDRQQAFGLHGAARRTGDLHVGVARELLEALVALPAAVVVDRHGREDAMPVSIPTAVAPASAAAAAASATPDRARWTPASR